MQDGDLTFKFQPDETAVLQEYAIPLAHEALKTLSAKYQFTPKGPILIEIFPDHDDFAVRNLGLPGLIGALGACFGRVVSIDSPQRAPAGHVLLAGDAVARAGARHHAADVEPARAALADRRHLGLRRGAARGPSGAARWRCRSRWRWSRGRSLKLKDLNSGFTKPETIALAYFEASLLVDHIVAIAAARRRCGSCC